MDNREERNKYYQDEPIQVDLYLLDGVDEAKVAGLDLDDMSLYIPVNVSTEGFQRLGITETVVDVLQELGVEGKDDITFNFYTLPEEYYLTEEESGIYREYFDKESDYYVGNTAQYIDYEYGEDFISDFSSKFSSDFSSEFSEEFISDFSSDFSSVFSEEFIDGIDLEWLEGVMGYHLELARSSKREGYYHEYDLKRVERIFQASSDRYMELVGYYPTVDEGKEFTGVGASPADFIRLLYGLELHHIHFIVEVEGIEEFVVFTFTGAYPYGDYEDELKSQLLEMPFMSDFYLSDIGVYNQGELHQRVLEGIG